MTISVPQASIVARRASLDGNFPVPRKSRDANDLPAMTNWSLIGPPAAAPLNEACCAYWSCAPSLRSGARSCTLPSPALPGR